MPRYNTDIEAIKDLLPMAAYPDGWAHHYQGGICSVCPACGNRALVMARVYDDEYDEAYDIGRACDFCSHQETF